MTVRPSAMLIVITYAAACRRPPGRAADVRDIRNAITLDTRRDAQQESAPIDAGAVILDEGVAVAAQIDAGRDVQRDVPVASDIAFQDTGPVIVCTEDDDCSVGRRHGVCFTPGLAAQYTQAFESCSEGRAWRGAHTLGTCIFHACTDANDSCPEGTRCGTLDMVPFPQRVCVRSSCRFDVDCRRTSGGRCASYLAAGRCQRGGYACSYPHDACGPRDPQRMCPYHDGMITFCAPNGAEGRFVCVDEPAIQP